MAATPLTFLFDLGGVLIDWNPRHFYRTVFPDAQAMERFLAEVCDSDWNRAMDAGKPFAQAIQERQRERPEFADLIACWRTRWDDMLRGPIPGSVALLEELRDQGHPLYALTNWSAETFPIALERFEFLQWFRRIVVSGQEGLAKPDPALFRRAIERCGLDPAQTLFIDDAPANLAAARALGFQGILFEDPAQLRRDLAERGLVRP